MVREHVVIISQDPYPDPRVEREIYTLIKYNFKVTFIGRIKKQPCLVLGRKFDDFDCIDMKFDRLTFSLLEPSLSRTIKKVRHMLNNIKSDVVIAINPIAGYIADRIGVPLVIDNHEYFYMEVKYQPLFGTATMHPLRKPIYTLGTLRRKWIYRVKLIEAELALKHPMIFTNHYIKQDFKKRFNVDGSNLFVLKNYPSKLEVEGIGNIIVGDKITFGYIGFDLPTQLSYRDLSATVEVLCDFTKLYDFKVLVAGVNHNYLCFQGVGWLDMHELYKLFTSIDFGLVTWTPHPIHVFFNPNKPYQYAIVGSVPIVTGTLKSVVEDLPKDAIVIRAEDRDTFKKELKMMLEKLLTLDVEERRNLREKIMEYARRKLIWENQENILLESIKKAH